jgi:hypothetical protein
MPPFLQGCEGFSGIRAELRAKEGQEESLNPNVKYPLPDLEPTRCLDCLAWAHRYYTDVPYLQMQLDQVKALNKELEKRNIILKFELGIFQVNKNPKRHGNIIIKRSTNVNAILKSELCKSSFSNV